MLKVAKVKLKNGQVGFIAGAGGGTCMPIGDTTWAEAENFREGFAKVRDGASGLWGHIDTSGYPVGLGIVWKEVGDFSEGIAAVQTVEGKWGHVGMSGLLIGAGGACWKAVGDFKEGFAKVKRDGVLEWGFIDKDGTLMETCWIEVADFRGGFACVQCDGEVDGMLEWGHISQKGILFDRCWMEVGDFYEGFAKAKGYQGWGFINHTGTMLDVGGCWQAVGNFSEGFAKVKGARGWTHISTNGLTFEMGGYWDEVGDFHNGFAKVHGVRGWSHVDTEGLPFASILWQDAGDFREVTLSNGSISAFAKVRGLHGEGHINREGQWCWRDVVDFHEKFDDNAEGDHGWGYVNPDGFTFKNIVWQEVGDFCENFAKVKGKNGWGHLSTEGTLLKAIDNWIEAGDFHFGFAKVKCAGGWGYTDTEGRLLTSPDWQDIEDFVEVLPLQPQWYWQEQCSLS